MISAGKSRAIDKGVFELRDSKYLSAVAVLEEIRPHEIIRDQESDVYFPEGHPRLADGVGSIEGRSILGLSAPKVGQGFFDYQVTRLRFYHNHNASVPLPYGAFLSPYNQRIWRDKDGMRRFGYQT